MKKVLLLVLNLFLLFIVSCSENNGVQSLEQIEPNVLKFVSEEIKVPNAHLQTGVAAGDLDNDGKIDLVFSAGRHEADQSFVAFNQGNRDYTFKSIGPRAGFTSVTLGKINKDNYFDVLLSGDRGRIGLTQSQAFLNPGNTISDWEKTWESSQTYSARNGTLSDLHGDGFSSILIASTNNTVDIYKNSDGKFSNTPTTSLLGKGAVVVGLAAVDLNKDGKKDVIMGSRHLWRSDGPATSTVYKNITQINAEIVGFETAPVFQFDENLQTVGVAAADLNNDGYPDIISANGGEQFMPGEDNFIYWGDSSGNFSVDRKTTYSSNSKSRLVHPVDINKDGWVDLILINAGQASTIFINKHDKTFISQNIDMPDEAVSRGVATGDFDNDGMVDIVIANYDSPSYIFYQQH